MCEPTLRVTKIQKFSTQYGPGVRTTVFLKGCPLSCAWCHNPETQAFQKEVLFSASICAMCGACAAVCPKGGHRLTEDRHEFQRSSCIACGACADACITGACEMAAKDMPISDVLAQILRDKPFFGSEGGVTLSGGEPMGQPEAALSLLRAAKAEGIGTAIETCGFFDEKWIEPLASCTDLFLWDFKDSDSARHEKYTGVGNEKILANLRKLDQFPVAIRLRCILVKGVNLNDEHLNAIADLHHSLRHSVGADLLPYHAYGSSKSVQIGREDSARRDWIPDKAEVERAKEVLRQRNVPVG